MYSTVTCDEGSFILLKVLNTTSMEPVHPLLELVITESGNDHTYPVDLTQLEGAGPWTGDCNQYNENLRFAIAEGSDISVRIKLPSED